MSDLHPFNDQEALVWTQLLAAHNEFLGMEQSHPNETTEWVTAIHQLQSLLVLRAARRNYPQAFRQIKK